MSKLGAVLDDNALNLFSSAADAATIRHRAYEVLVVMREALEQYSYRDDLGASISVNDPGDRVMATITTAFGIGRARLEFRAAANEPEGVLLFERQVYDEHDVICWQPVWALRVSPNDRVVKSGGKDPLILPSNSLNHNSTWSKRMSAVLHVLYGIAAGPVLDSGD